MTRHSQRIGWKVFQRLHDGFAQQGAGSDASTRRALRTIPDLHPAPTILDLSRGDWWDDYNFRACEGSFGYAFFVMEKPEGIRERREA